MNAADSMRNGQYFAPLKNIATDVHAAGFRGLNITGISHLQSSMIHLTTTEPPAPQHLEVESNHLILIRRTTFTHANSMATRVEKSGQRDRTVPTSSEVPRPSLAMLRRKPLTTNEGGVNVARGDRRRTACSKQRGRQIRHRRARRKPPRGDIDPCPALHRGEVRLSRSIRPPRRLNVALGEA